MQYINSNLSHREALNLHGSLPADRIEELIDDSETLELMQGIERDLDDVANQLPCKNFLIDEVKKLKEIAAKLSDHHKEELLLVIGLIQSELDDLSRSMLIAYESMESALIKV